MRIIDFYNHRVYIRANCLTPFFYKQQFDADFYEDVLEFISTENQRMAHRIVWALAKSDDFELLDFDQWIQVFEPTQSHFDYLNLHEELMKFYKNDETQKSQSQKEVSENNHYDISIIVSVMKQGLSLDILKLMTPYDLMRSFSEERGHEIREATHEDIDLLF